MDGGAHLVDFGLRHGLGFTAPITSFVSPAGPRFGAGQHVKVLPRANLRPGSYLVGVVEGVATGLGQAGTFYRVKISSVVLPLGAEPYRDVQPRVCAEDELQAA